MWIQGTMYYMGVQIPYEKGQFCGCLATESTLQWCMQQKVSFNPQLDEKYSKRVQIPAKAFLSPTLGNTCHTYYFAAR